MSVNTTTNKCSEDHRLVTSATLVLPNSKLNIGASEANIINEPIVATYTIPTPGTNTNKCDSDRLTASFTMPAPTSLASSKLNVSASISNHNSNDQILY